MQKYIFHICVTRYVNRVEVTPVNEDRDKSVFPFNRWINAHTTFNIVEFDSFLPHVDVNPEQRAKELRAKREYYMLSGKILGAPPQVSSLLQFNSL